MDRVCALLPLPVLTGAAFVLAGLVGCDRSSRGRAERDTGPIVMDSADVRIFATPEEVAAVDVASVAWSAIPEGS